MSAEAHLPSIAVVGPAVPTPPRPLAPRTRSPIDTISWIAIPAYVVGLAVSIRLWGLPRSRDQIFLRVVVGLFVFSLRNLKAWRRGVVLDWLPLFALLSIYDRLRGYADALWSSAHVRPQVQVDRLLFAGRAPTVRLQRALYSPGHLHWWDYAAGVVYLSHFFVIPLVAALLWKRAHARFRQFMFLYVSLTFLAFVTYALYPAMPPWLASSTGHLEPTTRIVRMVWGHAGVSPVAAMLRPGNGIANDVAAVPSLHAAYPMLLLLFFWSSRPSLRPLLVGYVLAMGFTLVYGAEHFVIDILLGWLYAFAVFAAGTAFLRRRAAQQAAVSSSAAKRAASSATYGS